MTTHGSVLDHCAGFPVAQFAPGEDLLDEGPASGRMFILKSGEVEVVRDGTRIITITEPGAIFGEIAVLIGGPHTATVRAVDDVEAYRIEDGPALLRESTPIAIHVARMLARRLIVATTDLTELKEQLTGRAAEVAVVDAVLGALGERPDNLRARRA